MPASLIKKKDDIKERSRIPRALSSIIDLADVCFEAIPSERAFAKQETDQGSKFGRPTD